MALKPIPLSSNHFRPVKVRCRHANTASDSYGGTARSSSVMTMTMSGRSDMGAFQSVGESGEHRVELLGQETGECALGEPLRPFCPISMVVVRVTTVPPAVGLNVQRLLSRRI